MVKGCLPLACGESCQIVSWRVSGVVRDIYSVAGCPSPSCRACSLGNGGRMAPEPLSAALRSISGFTASRSGSRVLFLSERTGWSEDYPTVGARLFLASPGPDSTVSPGVKSVLEPFERGLAHEESSSWVVVHGSGEVASPWCPKPWLWSRFLRVGRFHGDQIPSRR